MASLSKEEENYVRMSLLLTGISPRAVRCLFDKDKDLGPTALSATIQREHQKLKSLKGRRVINQAQWNVLHPGSSIPDSKNFDVTLMICLLRNLTKINPPTYGFDCLPPAGETTEGADLARIKYYRNILAHLDNTMIDTPTFTTTWVDVAFALGRLGGQSMVQECQELKIKILDQSNREIMLEIIQSHKEMKELQQSILNISEEVDTQKASHAELKLVYEKEVKTLTESFVNLKTDHNEKTKEVENLLKSYSSLETNHQTLAKSHMTLKNYHEEKTKEVEDLAKSYINLKIDNEEKTKEIANLKACQEDVIPWNIRGQINRKLETWKRDDKMFVENRAAKRVLQCVKTNSCITVTGSSGMGKTFTVRHIALKMAGDGYDILPVMNPNDIEKYYNPNKKTIFVIDNFCGAYTLNKHVLDKWKSLSDTITDILEDKETKIIVSCRSQVYQDDLFKTLPLFTSCKCNLMSKELCLLLEVCYRQRENL